MRNIYFLYLHFPNFRLYYSQSVAYCHVLESKRPLHVGNMGLLGLDGDLVQSKLKCGPFVWPVLDTFNLKRWGLGYFFYTKYCNFPDRKPNGGEVICELTLFFSLRFVSITIFPQHVCQTSLQKSPMVDVIGPFKRNMT